jgi:nicotinamidase-related amidase
MIRAEPFNFPYDGRLDPQKTALLVVDLQVDFLDEDGYFARKGYNPAPLRAIIPAVKSLVAAAREAGCRIIWTRQGYRADLADVTPYDLWRSRRAGIDLTDPSNSALVRGGAGFEILPELMPLESDIVVDKTANGAFYQTDLELILKAQGITHLLFCGITTDVCVHTTLREAADRKFQCLLVPDACASGDAYAHAAAIHMVTIEDGVFGVVANARDVVEGLAAVADRNPNLGSDRLAPEPLMSQA